MNPNFYLFKTKLASPFKFQLFLLTKLPAAFIAGLRIVSLEEKSCSVSVKHGWINQNPFRSMYFAVQSMAAEMTTGALAMGALYQRKPAVSMLIVKSSGEYFKKAIGKIIFSCVDGIAINNAIELAIQTGEPVTVDCTSTGVNDKGEVVSKFVFTWSFKRKSGMSN